MPRGDRLMFKYTGEQGEHYMGVPARDLYESDMDRLTDEQKATLGASTFYRPRNDADEVIAKAEQRIEKEAVAAAPPDAVSVTVEVADRPARSEAKK